MKNSTWLLILVMILGSYWLLRDNRPRYSRASNAARTSTSQPLNYDKIAVSDGLSTKAQALNLEKDLDVSLLPDIGRSVFREAAEKGLTKQPFLEYAITAISNRVREISTIDLNGDKQEDLILVKPEPAKSEQYLLLSIQVPDPKSYPLPEASAAEQWKQVQTFEVATMNIALNTEALTIEAQGNQHLYPNSHQQTYRAHDQGSSFLQTYMAMSMMNWLFFPPMFGFWGPGYGYGGYAPMGVGQVAANRGNTVQQRGYQQGTRANASSIRTRAGQAPRSSYQRAYGNKAPTSLNNLKASRRFSANRSTQVGSGGFGRNKAQRSVTSNRGFKRTQQSVRRGGFGRSSFGRRSFGGFGRRRGFGGFGRRSFGGFRRR